MDKTVNNDLNAIQNKAGDAVYSNEYCNGYLQRAVNKETTAGINNDEVTDLGE